MDREKYANSILNIIQMVSQQIPENPIQIKMEYLHNNMNAALYIYSTDKTSNIIRLLPYNIIQNSYSTWLALGGGDSAFLSMLTEFIVRLCGPASEVYFNTILDIMGIPDNTLENK